jgi:hypothetical protein
LQAEKNENGEEDQRKKAEKTEKNEISHKMENQKPSSQARWKDERKNPKK